MGNMMFLLGLRVLKMLPTFSTKHFYFETRERLQPARAAVVQEPRAVRPADRPDARHAGPLWGFVESVAKICAHYVKFPKSKKMMHY